MNDILRLKIDRFVEDRLKKNGHLLAESDWTICSEYPDEFFICLMLEDDTEDYCEQLFLTVYKDGRKAIFLDPEYN